MRAVDYILDWIYPVKCPFCGKLTGRYDVFVCDECEKTLPRTNDAASEQKFANIELCVAPLYYEGDVRESIHRYKFGGKCAYGRVYADFIGKTIDEKGISCDYITWVPLSRKRYRKRGYNQAKVIAEYISRKSGMRKAELLKKIRNNPAQSGTGGREARKANVSGVYRAINTKLLKGKTVLIIDDVVTTGATLSECARMLKAAGAEKVYAAALARHKD